MVQSKTNKTHCVRWSKTKKLENKFDISESNIGQMTLFWNVVNTYRGDYSEVEYCFQSELEAVLFVIYNHTHDFTRLTLENEALALAIIEGQAVGDENCSTTIRPTHKDLYADLREFVERRVKPVSEVLREKVRDLLAHRDDIPR